ncbi:Rne/Rng family ribonuclease [Novosphingobium tardum]|uniref:Ribonuclease E n=1 Tax=Novosphingobium tardum TaxID=1538021 RepID=A0ABV8RQY2_9SPHN
MTTRMLIDARHQEETRVAVLKGNRIEEFDFESADHKQIKGNIYLAKVTRVEPSLQAAFIDFGGNRHGFLAFSEIHPDYYQIPKEDREALLAEEAAHAEEEAALRAAEDADDEYGDDGGRDPDDDDESSDALADELIGEDGVTEVDTSEKDEVSTIEDGHVSSADSDSEAEGDDGEDEAENADRNGDEAEGEDGNRQRRGRGRGRGRAQTKQADELRDKRMALRRRYKIQDVIHRRQVLLVQVVKEERGNKGAALTTYLSLAGRYCVLMPNSSHGGGISRKISSAADRKRLKSIISELHLPKSMGCIVRTAGLSRTKPEIKRDFDYLARLWDEIRENTLKSSAPAMIHSDSDLIKRAIRDIYNRDIEEVVVEGEAGYRAAKDFMKLLMPSHARRVQPYADAVPLFQRYGAEDQLTAMYDPVVQLKSGGYLVINPTEALVSIDINSGRSTKEHGIEATAVSTNVEAAREIARQLRLRDMAGLIVIDFIDMEYGSNVRKVEKTLKEALKNDRARIQVGRISGFGLMEMSRQRLRTGVLEATTRSCPHCDGSGLVRTASSAGLSALRLIEDEAAKGKGSVITLFASQEAAIYLLNAKRSDLAEIEARYGVRVEVVPEGENEGAKMRVASSGPRPASPPQFAPILDLSSDDDVEEDFFDDEEEEEQEGPRESRGRGREDRGGESRAEGEGDDGQRRKRRKRRRGRRIRNEDGSESYAENGDDAAQGAGEADEGTEPGEDEAFASREEGEAGEGDQTRKRRRGRRRRRGGERNRDDQFGENGEAVEPTDETGGKSPVAEPAVVDAVAAEVSAPLADVPLGEEAPTPGKPRRSRRKAVAADTAAAPATEAETPDVTPAGETAAPVKPAPRKRTRKAEVAPVIEAQGEEPAPASAPEPEAATVAAPAPVKRPRTRKKADEPSVASGELPDTATPVEPTPATPAETPTGLAQDATTTELQDAEGEGESPRRGWWQRTFGA